MYYSSDIMGGANDNIEAQGGGIALYVNGDAGDISPNGDACAGKPDYAGGHTIANTVMQGTMIFLFNNTERSAKKKTNHFFSLLLL
jgi:hypothetical protein